MRCHTYADLLPSMSDAEYQALVASIRENGLRDPIVTILTEDGPMILDGRHRYRACCDADRHPTFIPYEGPMDDASLRTFVLDKNLNRRHLSESQRAMVAARLSNCGEGRPSKTSGIPLVSQSDVARELHISVDSVKCAAVILKHGIDALHQACDSGDVPVSVGAKVARLSEREQMHFVWEVALEIKPPHQILAGMHRDVRRALIEESAQRDDPGLPIGRRFPVVYADPPWRYEEVSMGHTDRSIENHYPTMTLDAICALPVADLAAEDAILFLWATPCQLAAALTAIWSWGYVYKSHLVWVKDRAGLGYHVRNQHELLLIARRGDLPMPEPSTVPSSVLTAARGRHSQKPEAIYDLIERMYPGMAKVELFSRSCRPGWTHWGLEAVPKT